MNINLLRAAAALAACPAAPSFANSKPPTVDAVNESWVMLAPYGDWPNAQGLQRFRREDATNIVNEFQSLASLPQRVLGLPWYVGHPDHEAFKADYKDKSAKGRIKKMEARTDGLWANVRWNDEGKALIKAEAFHGHSVNWRMRQNGGAWSPFSLKSVGFTNEPQIPVPPVLAANEKAEGAEVDVVMVANSDGQTPRERWSEWEESKGGKLHPGTEAMKKRMPGIGNDEASKLAAQDEAMNKAADARIRTASFRRKLTASRKAAAKDNKMMRE